MKYREIFIIYFACIILCTTQGQIMAIEAESSVPAQATTSTQKSDATKLNFMQKQAIGLRDTLATTGITNLGVIDAIAGTKDINYQSDSAIKQQAAGVTLPVQEKTLPTIAQSTQQSPQDNASLQIVSPEYLDQPVEATNLNDTTNSPLSPAQTQPSRLTQAANYLSDTFSNVGKSQINQDGSTSVKNLNGTTTTTYPLENNVNKKITISSSGQNATEVITNAQNKKTTVNNYSDYDTQLPTLTSMTITSPSSVEQRNYNSPNDGTGTYSIRYKTGDDTSGIKAGTVKTGTFTTDSSGNIAYDDPNAQEMTTDANGAMSNPNTNISTSSTGLQAIYDSFSKFTTKQQVTNFLDSFLQSSGLLAVKETIQAKTQFLSEWKPKLSLSSFSLLWVQFIKACTPTNNPTYNAEGIEMTTLSGKNTDQQQEQPVDKNVPTSIQKLAPQEPTDPITALRLPLYTFDAQGNPIAPVQQTVLNEPFTYDQKGNVVSQSQLENSTIRKPSLFSQAKMNQGDNAAESAQQPTTLSGKIYQAAKIAYHTPGALVKTLGGTGNFITGETGSLRSVGNSLAQATGYNSQVGTDNQTGWNLSTIIKDAKNKIDNSNITVTNDLASGTTTTDIYQPNILNSGNTLRQRSTIANDANTKNTTDVVTTRQGNATMIQIFDPTTKKLLSENYQASKDKPAIVVSNVQSDNETNATPPASKLAPESAITPEITPEQINQYSTEQITRLQNMSGAQAQSTPGN